MVVKIGDKVKVEFTGSLEDGTVFDSSEKHGRPLEFEVGAKMVIKGVDEAVIGMKKGEEKEVSIPPEKAYGPNNPALVKKIPRNQFPPTEKELKPGMILVIGLPNGQQIPSRIVDVNSEELVLDLNHPLAGKTLKFKLKLLEIETSK